MIPAPFDAVIPFHAKDSAVFWTYTIPHLLKNAVGLQRIFVVCSKDAFRDDAPQGVVFFDEARYPFSFNDIKSIIQAPSRVGWYYQQLLKLYAFLCIPDLCDQYLIWDSDTILLRPTAFFVNDYGEIRSLFAISPEYNPPYMEHMSRLHPSLERIDSRYGGVTHHQPWQKKILSSLFEAIEHRHSLPFWKAYLSTVDPRHYGGSGCADYEVVFTWSFRMLPGTGLLRPLRWANRRELPDPTEQLDFVSLHAHMQPLVSESKS